ncbi:hypothetical protein KKH3_01820 [Pectobacterium actinidiae]|nr:hypothetical protein KKH3_01820 [Pectobacterium actinidiae]
MIFLGYLLSSAFHGIKIYKLLYMFVLFESESLFSDLLFV